MNSNENNQNQSQNTVSSQASTPQSTSIINPSTVTEISKIKNIPTIQPSVASPITTPESTIPV